MSNQLTGAIRPAGDVLKEFRPAGQGVLDARGRTLQEGDEIILATGGPQFFRVAKIAPDLHPQAPAGLMVATITCTIAFRAMTGEPNPEFVRVQTIQEIEARQRSGS